MTSGTWSLWCSEALDKPQEGLAPNLGLILNPTHGGRAELKVSPELLRICKPLTGFNLIDPGDHASWIKAPSVFTKGDELVIWRLHVDELLDVYNAEVVTQKELNNCWRLGQCLPSNAFVNAAPLKFLIAIRRLFYDKLHADGWPLGLPPVNEDKVSRKRSIVESTVESATKAAHQVSQQLYPSGQSKRPRLSPDEVSSNGDQRTTPPFPIRSLWRVKW